MLQTPFSFADVVSAPHDRVAIVDAKKYLALDAARARDSFIETLVDPLNTEQCLCWETLEYVPKDFSDVEDLVSGIAVWSVLFGSKRAGSVSVMVGALAFLALGQQFPLAVLCRSGLPAAPGTLQTPGTTSSHTC